MSDTVIADYPNRAYRRQTTQASGERCLRERAVHARGIFRTEDSPKYIGRGFSSMSFRNAWLPQGHADVGCNPWHGFSCVRHSNIRMTDWDSRCTRTVF